MSEPLLYLPEPFLIEVFQACDTRETNCLSWTEFVAEYAKAMLSAKLSCLRCYYHVYNPAKLQDVKKTATEWEGRESMLWKGLVEKYGPYPQHYLVLDPTHISYREARHVWKRLTFEE